MVEAMQICQLHGFIFRGICQAFSPLVECQYYHRLLGAPKYSIPVVDAVLITAAVALRANEHLIGGVALPEARLGTGRLAIMSLGKAYKYLTTYQPRWDRWHSHLG
jgi:hypothetical protein